MSIKAISVKQPWAWALVSDIRGSVIGNKTVENRSWNTSYRGPLLICSSKRAEPQAVFQEFEGMTGILIPTDDPYMQEGMILGVVYMSGCLDIETYERCITYAYIHSVLLTTVVESVARGSMNVDEYDRKKDHWAVGPYCHIYSNVRRLPPMRTTGQLGLYNIKKAAGLPIDAWVSKKGVFVR